MLFMQCNNKCRTQFNLSDCVAGPTVPVVWNDFHEVSADYPHVYKQETEGKGNKGDVECDEEEEVKEHLLWIK